MTIQVREFKVGAGRARSEGEWEGFKRDGRERRIDL